MYWIKSPSNYKQSPGILQKIGAELKPYGNSFLFLATPSRWGVLGEGVIKSMEEEGLKWEYEAYEHAATRDAMDKAGARLNAGSYDALVVMGGGKLLDTGKGVAMRGGVPVIVVPTTATTDAAGSSVAVLHTYEGGPDGIEAYSVGPALVLVDSKVIAEAPVEHLVAGMGDALSTYFEARVHFNHKIPLTNGSQVTLAGLAQARACYDIIMQYGREALLAAKKREVNEALEIIVMANTYMSCFGFENGGLSSAHGVQNTFELIPECRDVLHGMAVGFGTLCLLIMEDFEQAVVDEVFSFCKDVGLPLTLAELNLTEDAANKMRAALEQNLGAGHPVFPMPTGKTVEDLFEAVMKTDELGRKFK